MKKIFFFSDVHFGLQDKQHEKDKEQRVLTFLSHVQKNGEQLFILGDLFDYWFEYKYVVPRGYHHILSRLAALVESGVKVLYVAGNHDFWLKDFFPEELGIPIYKDPFGIELRGKRFFIHHGDGLAVNDTGYRILKKILRSRISIFLYSLVHPDWTAPVARGSSKTSREYTGNKDFGETDGMVKFAKERISEGYDYVIMGHRHKPLEQKIDDGLYLNLGDWISYNTYAEFDGKNIQLKEWKNETFQRRPPAKKKLVTRKKTSKRTSR